MLRLTLAQMRRSAGRLAAAGVAIVISTAFVAITLLAANVMTATTTASFGARYLGSDLVVSGGIPLTDDDVAALAAVDGVAAAEGELVSWAQLTAGGRTTVTAVLPASEPAALLPVHAAQGRLPEASGEVALPESAAELLGVTVGGRVTAVATVQRVVDGEETVEAVESPLTVVGLVADPNGAFTRDGGAAVAMRADVMAWSAQSFADGAVQYDVARVLLDDGVSPAQVRDGIAAALSSAQGTEATAVQALTPAEIADARMAAQQGGQNVVMTVFGLVFASIALLVAALVIANTFQVLVAQRLRTLALLRCVGAAKGQLRRSVLLEAALLGLLTSLAGVALGIGLVQLALAVAGGMDLGVPLPSTAQVTLEVVLVPLATGTVVTVLASLAPAALATRVAPLAALRPLDAPSLARRAGKLRLVLSVLGAVGGFGLLARGLGLANGGDADLGLMTGVLGGAASFVGVVLGAVFWMPWVVSLAGRLAGLTGPTARLAAANTLRNPRRTAATATALLIGVTLVTTMTTAAASARATMDAELDSTFPVDATLSTEGVSFSEDGRAVAIPADVVTGVCALDDVRACAPNALVEASLASRADGDSAASVRGIDPEAVREVLHSGAAAAPLTRGTVVVPAAWAAHRGLTDGEIVTVTGADGYLDLTVAVTPLGGSVLLLVPEDLEVLEAGAPRTGLWVALEDPAAAATAMQRISDIAADADSGVRVGGAAAERAQIGRVIDTMLAVVVGLLAAAVVIALIGVANTLSLSVIERQKESATLRAIGLTRGRLRGMLALEGVLIALVGAVLGLALGLAYGWLGSATALALVSETTLAFPWRDTGLVLLVAVVAGLLASVLAGRTAARTSPVAALATE